MVLNEKNDPEERTSLPFLNDIENKTSIWKIIKECFGSITRDMSTITVPVYFNDPTSLLQKAAQSMEYIDIMEKAARTKEPAKRLAYVAAFTIS